MCFFPYTYYKKIRIDEKKINKCLPYANAYHLASIKISENLSGNELRSFPNFHGDLVFECITITHTARHASIFIYRCVYLYENVIFKVSSSDFYSLRFSNEW